MSLPDWIPEITALIGLVASIAGLWSAYVSFLNPMIRFRWYLKDHSQWEKFIGTEPHITIYRHKRYSNVQLVVDWNRVVVENYHESWINDVLFPDKMNNATYYVRLEMNGMLLAIELFASLDGHRFFVPVPRLSVIEGNELYYYEAVQMQLATIVGRFGLGISDIHAFAKHQARPISTEPL